MKISGFPIHGWGYDEEISCDSNMSYAAMVWSPYKIRLLEDELIQRATTNMVQSLIKRPYIWR